MTDELAIELVEEVEALGGRIWLSSIGGVHFTIHLHEGVKRSPELTDKLMDIVSRHQNALHDAKDTSGTQGRGQTADAGAFRRRRTDLPDRR